MVYLSNNPFGSTGYLHLELGLFFVGISVVHLLVDMSVDMSVRSVSRIG